EPAEVGGRAIAQVVVDIVAVHAAEERGAHPARARGGVGGGGGVVVDGVVEDEGGGVGEAVDAHVEARAVERGGVAGESVAGEHRHRRHQADRAALGGGA